MQHKPPEADWKTFRELREVALQRFSQRILDEVERVTQHVQKTAHERYVDIFRLVRARDREMAAAFNDPRRSQMVAQLAAIYAHDLLQSDEFARFSDSTRDTVKFLAEH